LAKIVIVDRDRNGDLKPLFRNGPERWGENLEEMVAKVMIWLWSDQYGFHLIEKNLDFVFKDLIK